MCRLFSKKEIASVAVILWGIWQNRNSQVWKGSSLSPAAVLRNSLNHHHQWLAVNCRVSGHQSSNSVLSASHWEKPTFGWVKCNIDASVRSGFCGFAGVIRDVAGSFIAGKQILRVDFDAIDIECWCFA
ncbi:hypothetical protein LguiA_033749 [Lonicera macranthoides]